MKIEIEQLAQETIINPSNFENWLVLGDVLQDENDPILSELGRNINKSILKDKVSEVVVPCANSSILSRPTPFRKFVFYYREDSRFISNLINKTIDFPKLLLFWAKAIDIQLLDEFWDNYRVDRILELFPNLEEIEIQCPHLENKFHRYIKVVKGMVPYHCHHKWNHVWDGYSSCEYSGQDQCPVYE